MARNDARGLTLPARKDAATAASLHAAPAPAIAILALDQGRGRAARALVRIGDAVRLGTRIAEADDPSVVPLHAPIAGRVIAIESRPTPTGHGPCIVIENDGSDAREREPATLDWASMAPEALAATLREAGIAGLGGAAYATAAKLYAARSRAAGHLLLNGAECEPWICCDDALMRARADDVVEGARVLLHATGAVRCSVAIEDDKPEAIAAIERAIAAAGDPRIALVTLATRYPAGAEGPLVAALTGVEVPRGGHPPEVGALCHNVGTAAAVAAAVRGEPVVSRVVTVTGGGVATPANLEARLGTPIAGRRDRALDRGDCLGLVVLDCDAAARGPGRVHQHAGALDHVVGPRAHQRVVAADPGFALGAVQQQVAGRAAARGVELGRGRIRGAAEARDAGLAQRGRQCLGRERGPVEVRGLAFARVGAVVLDHDAGPAAGRRRAGLDRDHGTCDRRVQRHHRRVVGFGDPSPEADRIADPHDRPRRAPAALVQRHGRNCRDRCRAQRGGGRGILARRKRESAGVVACHRGQAARDGSAVTIVMQSTGQGGRHSSQPVQRSAITVCMRFCAPTIASTGQAGRQRAQPMQRASSISATRGAVISP